MAEGHSGEGVLEGKKSGGHSGLDFQEFLAFIDKDELGV
jgi:hypothetical protein